MPIPMEGWVLAATQQDLDFSESEWTEVWFHSFLVCGSSTCGTHHRKPFFLFERSDSTCERLQYKGSLWCKECILTVTSRKTYWLPEFVQYLKENHPDLVLEEF